MGDERRSYCSHLPIITKVCNNDLLHIFVFGFFFGPQIHSDLICLLWHLDSPSSLTCCSSSEGFSPPSFSWLPLSFCYWKTVPANLLLMTDSLPLKAMLEMKSMGEGKSGMDQWPQVPCKGGVTSASPTEFFTRQPFKFLHKKLLKLPSYPLVSHPMDCRFGSTCKSCTPSVIAAVFFLLF